MLLLTKFFLLLKVCTIFQTWKTQKLRPLLLLQGRLLPPGKIKAEKKSATTGIDVLLDIYHYL